MIEVISLKEYPERLEEMIAWFQAHWANEDSMAVYADCLSHALDPQGTLPQWYFLIDQDRVLGGAGLIPNDFNSRMDLWPWICALYIEKSARGHHYGQLLLKRAEQDAAKAGFSHVYLATDHIGYYEKYGYSYLGQCFHPWNEASRVYVKELKR